MRNLTIAIKDVRYSIVVYSNNTVLIKTLENYYANKNIGIIIRDKIKKNGRNLSSYNNNYENNIKSIIDLADENVSYLSISRMPKELLKNTVFILMGSIKNISQARKLHNLYTHVYFVDILSKKAAVELSAHLEDHLMNNKPFRVVLTDGKNRNYKSNKNIYFPASIFFIIIMLPYVFVLCSFLYNRLLMETKIYYQSKINTVLFLADKGFLMNSKISAFAKIYNQVELGYLLYGKAFSYHEKIKEDSTTNLKNIKELADLHTESRQVINSLVDNGTKTNNEDRLGFIDTKDKTNTLAILDIKSRFVTKVTDLLQTVNAEEGHLLFIIQDGEASTPTGGSVDMVYVIDIKSQKWELVETFDRETLKKMFKGKLTNTNLIPEKENLIIFDRSYNIREKYLNYKTIFKEIFNYEILGIITIENNSAKEIERYNTFFRDENPSTTNLIDVYKNIYEMIKSMQINIYLTDSKGNIFINEFLTENGDYDTKGCYGYKIEIGNYSEDKNGSGSHFKLSVNEQSGGSLSLKLSIANNAEKEDFVITSNNGLVLNSISKTLKTTVVEYNENTIRLALRTEGDINSERSIEYLLPISGCADGYGVDLIKTSGTSELFVDYDIKTNGTKYLYLNKNLTGHGNRFYNSKLVKIIDELSFRFVGN